MKYYFVSYTYQKPGKEQIHANSLINESPLKWFVETKQTYQEESYVLLNWIEITEEEYNQYEGWLD